MKKALSNSKYWEMKILYSVLLGYGCYYTVRQNYNIVFSDELFGISKDYIFIGWAFTVNSIVYGVGKVVNGYLSDRTSSRFFFSIGLFISGILSLVAGFCNSTFLICIIFVINGWVQSMGFPSTAKLMLSWTSKDKIASRWSIATCSHQIGGVSIMLVGGFILENYGWRYVLILPGIFAIFASFILYAIVKDSPNEVGVSVINGWSEDTPSAMTELLCRLLYDKHLQLLCMGNMFAYTIRLGILNWAPIFLTQYYGFSSSLMGIQVGFYEFMGFIGSVSIGFFIDRLFKDTISNVGIISMFLFLVFFFLLSNLITESILYSFILMGIIGFFVYIPQIIVGIISTMISKKSDIGMINGFIGMFGYIGSAIAGIGNGEIIAAYGWRGSFIFFLIIGGFGLLTFISLSTLKSTIGNDYIERINT